jgi:hypothetical protein
MEKTGFLLSVTYGNIRYANKSDSFYLLYAGILTNAHGPESLTNYVLPKHLKYLDNFERDELDFIFKNGVTTYRYSFLNDFVLFNNVTFVKPDNEYYFFDDYKTCFIAATRITTFLKKNLGKNLKELIDSHILPRGIEDILKNMLDVYISNYTFSITLGRDSVVVPFQLRSLDNTHFIKAKASAPII